jgi:hypothetical protein
MKGNANMNDNRDEAKGYRNMRRYAAMWLIVVLCALVFAACGSKDAGKSEGDGADISASKDSVTVSIDCETLADVNPELAAEISENGVIFERSEVEIDSGQTAMDVLRATKVDFKESGGFVSEIAGLASGEGGSMSGWLFLVNGDFPSVGASELEVQSGDVLEWRYSCDGGEDIGFSFD